MSEVGFFCTCGNDWAVWRGTTCSGSCVGGSGWKVRAFGRSQAAVFGGVAFQRGCLASGAVLRGSGPATVAQMRLEKSRQSRCRLARGDGDSRSGYFKVVVGAPCMSSEFVFTHQEEKKKSAVFNVNACHDCAVCLCHPPHPPNHTSAFHIVQ